MLSKPCYYYCLKSMPFSSEILGLNSALLGSRLLTLIFYRTVGCISRVMMFSSATFFAGLICVSMIAKLSKQVYNLLSMSNKSFHGCVSAASIAIFRRGRLSVEYGLAREKARSQSFQQTFEKLPRQRMKMMLTKLGAVNNYDSGGHIPSEQQRSQFRKRKYQQLRKSYQRRRYLDQRAYVNQLDEIVIDCYKPGENRSSGEIWRNYRQNYKNLAFRTQQVLNTRKFTYA